MMTGDDSGFKPSDDLRLMYHELIRQYPPSTLLEQLKVIAMAAILGALTLAAWLIPSGWLRWPAVAVTGFLFIASLIVVYAMFEGRKDEASPT